MALVASCRLSLLLPASSSPHLPCSSGLAAGVAGPSTNLESCAAFDGGLAASVVHGRTVALILDKRPCPGGLGTGVVPFVVVISIRSSCRRSASADDSPGRPCCRRYPGIDVYFEAAEQIQRFLTRAATRTAIARDARQWALQRCFRRGCCTQRRAASLPRFASGI